MPALLSAASTASGNTPFTNLTACVTAPVLYGYVWWCLQQALHDKLSTLYFLARDGHVLCRIAQQFCQMYHLPLQCRYLYVSRLSLRMPMYHKMGEEAYALLLVRGAKLTPRHTLERLCLNATERQAVYSEIGLSAENENQLLSRDAFSDLCQRLRKSKVYHDFLMEKSQAAYAAAVGYFRQEGLLNAGTIGIVDSGWNGSMQNCLAALLESTGENVPAIKGYYFGLFQPPKKGAWAAWYFTIQSPLSQLVRFNNNLYECMCAAPHNTTMGYLRQTDGTFAPVLKEINEIDRRNIALAMQQESVCEQFTKAALSQFPEFSMDLQPLHQISRKLLPLLMYHPDADEAQAMGQFLFCDDVGELYAYALAEPGQEAAIKQFTIFQRIWKKLRHREEDSAEPYWAYGALACSRLSLQWWYRWNYAVWNGLRYALCRKDRKSVV